MYEIESIFLITLYLQLIFLLIKTNRFVSEKTRILCKILLDTE